MRHDETRQVVEGLTKGLCKALNGGSRKEAVLGVMDALKREHRYLLLLLLLLLRLLERSDARNEAAIRACGDLRKAVEDRIYWPE